MSGETYRRVARWGARALVALQSLVVADAVWLVAHTDGLSSVAAVVWLAAVILVLVRLLRRYDLMSGARLPVAVHEPRQ